MTRIRSNNGHFRTMRHRMNWHDHEHRRLNIDIHLVQQGGSITTDNMTPVGDCAYIFTKTTTTITTTTTCAS